MKRIATIVAVCAAIGLLLAACGGGSDSQEDGRVRAIGSLSENAVDAWVLNGPVGLYNVLHPRIMDQCTREDYLSIMEGEPRPTAWRNTKDIALSEDLNQATATVIVVIDGQDVEQQWRFETENNVRWRVTDAPGVAECAGA
jgi:hypothetical protein